jgi:hypothetical protein
MGENARVGNERGAGPFKICEREREREPPTGICDGMINGKATPRYRKLVKKGNV